MDYQNYDIDKLPDRKRIEMKMYPFIKQFYVKGYSLYGFYWAYKLIVGKHELPGWEHWALWTFAMLSLYIFSRENNLDGFFDGIDNKKKQYE